MKEVRPSGALVACLVSIAAMISPLVAAAQPGAGTDRSGQSPQPPERTVEVPEGESVDPGETIDRVGVTGNMRVERESILQAVDTEAGQPLAPKSISRDIHRIYQLGYFSDIRVDATETPDGRLVVTYIVKEKPAVAEIRYDGNQEIDDEKLDEKVTLEQHTILDVAGVKENVETIRQAYVDKGYYLAEVDYEIRRPDKYRNQVVVVYNVREFAKVQVKRITLLGNDNLPDSELKRIMKTQEGSFLSLVTDQGSFKEERFEKDLQRLTAYYYDQGFVEVNVETPTIRLSRDKRFLYITVRIDEGQQYDVGSVAIEGDLIEEREELRSMVGLEEGKTFQWGQMRKDAQGIKKSYQNEGYAYAKVQPKNRINREAQTVDITYDITQGDKVFFERIKIAGNERTQDKVIRRELEIEEGEMYTNTDIEQSKQEVNRLGFFENVNISTQRTSDSDRIKATVKVKEKRTGNVQVGAGFSSTESFIFNARVSQNNLFGRAQSLSLQAQLSAVRSMFNLRFTEPWLFDSRWEFSINAYNYEVAYRDFNRNSTGGDVTFGYPISEGFDWDIPGELTARGIYKLEDVEIEAGGRTGGGLQRPGSFFEGGITSSVAGELEYDTRNNRLFPTDGQLHTAKIEYADENLTFSETQFAKFDWETRLYVPLFWEFVFRVNGEFGYITGLSEDQPVPLFERYFVGGPRTMRGFNRYQLGPARNVARTGGDPSSSLSAYNIGGNKQMLLTAEIEFPILKAAGFKGVVFADAGNAFDNGQPPTLALDVFQDPDNNYTDALRTAVGLGVRWRSPLGPLRFEWGWPLQRLRGEDPVVFEFSIGNAF